MSEKSSRDAELEALRANSIVGRQRSQLNTAPLPDITMEKWYQQQRNMSKEDQQKKLEAASTLHNYRGKEIPISKKRDHVISPKFANFANGANKPPGPDARQEDVRGKDIRGIVNTLETHKSLPGSNNDDAICIVTGGAATSSRTIDPLSPTATVEVNEPAVSVMDEIKKFNKPKVQVKATPPPPPRKILPFVVVDHDENNNKNHTNDSDQNQVPQLQEEQQYEEEHDALDLKATVEFSPNKQVDTEPHDEAEPLSESVVSDEPKVVPPVEDTQPGPNEELEHPEPDEEVVLEPQPNQEIIPVPEQKQEVVSEPEQKQEILLGPPQNQESPAAFEPEPVASVVPVVERKPQLESIVAAKVGKEVSFTKKISEDKSLDKKPLLEVTNGNNIASTKSSTKVDLATPAILVAPTPEPAFVEEEMKKIDVKVLLAVHVKKSDGDAVMEGRGQAILDSIIGVTERIVKEVLEQNRSSPPSDIIGGNLVAFLKATYNDQHRPYIEKVEIDDGFTAAPKGIVRLVVREVVAIFEPISVTKKDAGEVIAVVAEALRSSVADGRFAKEAKALRKAMKQQQQQRAI